MLSFDIDHPVYYNILEEYLFINWKKQGLTNLFAIVREIWLKNGLYEKMC